MKPSIKLWDGQAPLDDPAIPQDAPQLTPYLLEKSTPTACIIVCPGGGYGGLADYEGEPISLWLNSLGIASFVLAYRLTPYHHPAQLLDANRAIRFVRAHSQAYGIDPRRIGILGFSAGGHLAATAGTHFDQGDPASGDPMERVSSRPDALVLCYPVITFGEYRHDGSRTALLGENPPAGLVTLLSNELQVTPATPPTFLFHTANDQAVPVENSLLFASALSRCQVLFDLHVFADGAHGAALGEGDPALSLWPTLCAAWLGKIGFIP